MTGSVRLATPETLTMAEAENGQRIGRLVLDFDCEMECGVPNPPLQLLRSSRFLSALSQLPLLSGQSDIGPCSPLSDA